MNELFLLFSLLLGSVLLLTFCQFGAETDVLKNIESVRKEIKSNFKLLVERLHDRENELLDELDVITAKYSEDQESREKSILSLEKLRDCSNSDLEESPFVKSVKDRHINDIELKLNELKQESTKPQVRLEWNEEMLQTIRSMGSIVTGDQKHKSSNIAHDEFTFSSNYKKMHTPKVKKIVLKQRDTSE